MQVLRSLLLVAAMAGAIVGCRPTKTTGTTIPSEPLDVAAARDVRADVEASTRSADGDAAALGTQNPPSDVPTTVTILTDGTLVVESSHTLFARAPDGTSKTYALARGFTVRTSPVLPGVVVDNGDEATLLATPSLAVLYQGKGRVASGSANVILVEDGPAVLLQHGSELLRLPLAKDLAVPRLESVVPVAGGSRLNVTITADVADASTPGMIGLLYDAKKRTVIGRGVPLPSLMMSAQHGSRAGDLGFVVEGSKLLRIDLKSGAVQRQATVRCPKDTELGNPTPSPSGDLLLVTCNDDGVVLDGVTLAERRRIPRIMPGCDNGTILGGVILPDGHTLRLEGCGGEAKVDLATGKYACGDSSGIVGAPYEMTPGAASPGSPPAGRDHLPRCTKEDAQTSALGTSSRYRTNSGQTLSVERAGAPAIVLEEGSGYPVLAPDEGSFAYTRGDKVVVRGLPEGKIRFELTPFAK